MPLEAGAQRLIIATCEKGTVENIDEMRQIKGNLDKIKKENPNFVEMAAKAVFRVPDVPLVADAPPKFQITAAQKKRAALMKKRSELRIGMPRVLNMYSQTPVFTGYFASLGIKAENICLLGLHQRGAVQGRRQARRHRPVLPLQAGHSARAQPALTRCTPRSRSTSSSSR